MTKTEEAEHEWTDDDQAIYLAKQAERRNERLTLYSNLESRLSIPNGYIDSLYSEADDWAYIVKLAVLCEAAVTHVLVLKVGTGEDLTAWQDHFSSLPNGRRLDLAYKLNLIPKSVKEKLDAISQFRNSFAHDVSNLGGSLSQFFKNCSPDRKRELSSKLLGIKHKNDQDWRFYISNTRLLIGVGAVAAIKALAKFGLDPASTDVLEKDWELADMYHADSTQQPPAQDS